MLSRYLEFERNKPPAPVPQRYVFTHPGTYHRPPSVVVTGNHAETKGDGWHRMTHEAAVDAGVIDENGKSLRGSEPVPT